MSSLRSSAGGVTAGASRARLARGGGGARRARAARGAAGATTRMVAPADRHGRRTRSRRVPRARASAACRTTVGSPTTSGSGRRARCCSSPDRTCPARARCCARSASTSSSRRPARRSPRDRSRCRRCDLQTSLRVQDSLELGLSYFMAALARLKGSSTPRSTSVPAACCSICSTRSCRAPTASSARSPSARSRGTCSQAGAIGVMTTHDLSLAAEEPLATRGASWCTSRELVSDNGEMRFDYRLRPGLATSRNALQADEADWHRPVNLRRPDGALRLVAVTCCSSRLTAAMTWPQVEYLGTRAPPAPGRLLQHVAAAVVRARARDRAVRTSSTATSSTPSGGR